MTLTPRSERWRVLASAGVPERLLRWIAALPAHGLGPSWMHSEEGAYEQLPGQRWPELHGHTVTPVYTSCSGDRFLLHLQAPSGSERFVSFRLSTGVRADYGPDAQRAIADHVIEIYETDDAMDAASLTEVATALGLTHAETVVAGLFAAEGRRGTFEDDATWRREVLPALLSGEPDP